jgi:hypothetical protein
VRSHQRLRLEQFATPEEAEFARNRQEQTQVFLKFTSHLKPSVHLPKFKAQFQLRCEPSVSNIKINWYGSLLNGLHEISYFRVRCEQNAEFLMLMHT